MDKRKLREEPKKAKAGQTEPQSEDEVPVFSYLKTRNCQATERSRSRDGVGTVGRNAVRSELNPGHSPRVPEDPAAYTRFLEELLAKAMRRDGEMDSLKAKIVELQAKCDSVATNNALEDSKLAKKGREIQLLEQRVTVLERRGLTGSDTLPRESAGTSGSRRAEYRQVSRDSEKGGSQEQRRVGEATLGFKDERIRKLEQNVAKIEKQFNAAQSLVKESCLRELMVYTNNYLSSRLNQITSKVSKEDGSLGIRIVEPTEQIQDWLTSIREEFNVKLQLLMEELQQTVTLKTLEKKLLELDATKGWNHSENFKNLESRLNPLEEGFTYLKSSVERILKIVETNLLATKDNLTSTYSLNQNPLADQDREGETFDELRDGHKKLSLDELYDPRLLTQIQSDVREYFDTNGNMLPATPNMQQKQKLSKGGSKKEIPSGMSPTYFLFDSSNCEPGQPMRCLLPAHLLSSQQLAASGTHRFDKDSSSEYNTLRSSGRLHKPPRSRPASTSPGVAESEGLAQKQGRLGDAETEASWHKPNRSTSAEQNLSRSRHKESYGQRVATSIMDPVNRRKWSPGAAIRAAESGEPRAVARAQGSVEGRQRSGSSKALVKQRKKDKIRSLLGQKNPAGKLHC